MKRYRPSRYALNFIRFAMAALSTAATVLSLRFLRNYPLVMYLLIGLFWSVSFLMGTILLPLYFSRTSYSVSSAAVSKFGGMIFTQRQFMKGSSVQYITTVITPFSGVTAFNFIVINALGGKIFLGFLSRNDALEITSTLNKAIEKRKEPAPKGAK